MAQPEITVDQITAAPSFDGSNISSVDAISLNGVVDTGYAKIASSNTFTTLQTIDNSGTSLQFEVKGTTLSRISTSTTTSSWFMGATGLDFFIGDTSATAFEITTGTGGRPTLKITNTDVEFNGKNLNRANVITSPDANFTLSLSHASQYVRANFSTNKTITVPANASVAFPIGTQIDIHWTGAGSVTISGAGGVTINTPESLILRKNHSTATLIKVNTDEWDLVGDMRFL